MRLYDDATLLSEPTQLQPRRKRSSSGLLVRGCLLIFTLGALGLAALVMAGPGLFRALPENVQGGLARRVALLDAWLPTPTITPTRAYAGDYLPTSDSARAQDALALLQATNLPTNPPTLTLISATARPASAIPTNTKAAFTKAVLSASALQATLVPSPTVPPPTVLLPTVPPTAPPATAMPSAAIPATILATAIPATAKALPAALHLDSSPVIYQTWNNCGPANLAQVLNAYGIQTTQKDTGEWLKPTVNDANVSPWQIVTYVNSFTKMRALQRVNGSLTLLKRLLAARFRPLIETGFSLPKEGWMGHYLTPVGYDDVQGVLLGQDTYLGAGADQLGVREPYADLDNRWQDFNRLYIVIYEPQREEELRALLGTDADAAANVQGGLEQARQDAQADPTNAFAWFNLGTNYVLLHDYKQAALAYDQARNAGKGLPWRMLWYQFGPFAAYYNVADYKTALQLIEVTLGTTHNVEEIYFWRGMVMAAQGKATQATNDFKYALQYNPNYKPAADALASLKAGSTPASPDIP